MGLPLFFPSTAMSASPGPSGARPNIVLIVADDLGYGDFGCYGATKISTPAIDKLAAQGIQFRDAYVASSICSPSRYSILTGRYCWRTRLKFGVLAWFATPLIEPGRATLASLLKRNGYYTACVGKWHLGFNWALKPNAPANPDKTVFNTWDRNAQQYIDFLRPVTGGPLDRGFDSFFGLAGSLNMMPYVYIRNDRVVEPPTVQKTHVYEFDQKTLKAPDWDSRTVNQVLTSNAVAIINDHFATNAGQPLFLYFATTAIHRPCLPTFTKGKSRAGLRGDMVLEFDWSVDQVVQALQRHHALENTLLLVTSDNGPRPGDPLLGLEKYKTEDFARDLYLPYFADYKPEYKNPFGNKLWQTGWLTYGHRAAGPLLGFKEDAWEGGLRVPLIIHWPARIQPGQTNYHTVCMTDLLATFADLLGQRLGPGEGEDSYSFFPNLTQPGAPQVRKSMVVSSGASGAFVVRRGDWKYIRGSRPGWGQTYYPNGPNFRDDQLYDLRSDLNEQTNLCASKPQVVMKLKKLLARVRTHPHTEGK
jgi:arylsulfatase A